MDIYVVLDGARVVGASAKLQGAELIRAEEAARLADYWVRGTPVWNAWHRAHSERIRIENHELKDLDD